jgi:hypothetical protein
LNEYSIIGLVLALIGILKGKEFWEYLKQRNASKIEVEKLSFRLEESDNKNKLLIEEIETLNKELRRLRAGKRKLEKQINHERPKHP